MPFEKLLVTIPRPPKLICIGLNYKDHAAESHPELPKTPLVFTKFSNAIIIAGDLISHHTRMGNDDLFDTGVYRRVRVAATRAAFAADPGLLEARDGAESTGWQAAFRRPFAEARGGLGSWERVPLDPATVEVRQMARQSPNAWRSLDRRISRAFLSSFGGGRSAGKATESQPVVLPRKNFENFFPIGLADRGRWAILLSKMRA